MESNLARDKKGYMNSFYRSTSSKKKMRGNMGLLLNEAGDL